MTRQAIFNAIIELTLMSVVVGAYGALARRYRALWHPLSIVMGVVLVSVVVSVAGEALFASGWSGVPAMARRSATGGFGWGLLIAIVVWVVRRGLEKAGWIDRASSPPKRVTSPGTRRSA